MHACIWRYKRSNCSNKIWTCTAREGKWPGDTQMPFISRISSIEPLQNKSLFQVLREDFLTLVFPSLVFLGEMYTHHEMGEVYTTAHTYIAYIGKYPPSPPPGLIRVLILPLTHTAVFICCHCNHALECNL